MESSYLFNNTRQISLNTRLKLGSFSSHAFSTNLSNFFPFVLFLSFPNALRLAFISAISESTVGEGLTWQVFQQMWRVLSVAIFLLMMIFALLVQDLHLITDLRDSFYFSYASLFDHYCWLRRYFLVFQIRQIYEACPNNTFTWCYLL